MDHDTGTMTSEEIEIKFRLDSNGRTIRSDSKEDSTINYESKTVQAYLSDTSTTAMDELLFDSEISDNGLMPRTFWVGAKDEPRCNLEQIALDIFRHHVPIEYDYDADKSGVEWWVQIRPSPDKVGRYAMHDSETSEHDMSKTGISFHWDKDEDLRILCGGDTYIHPHLSTVTYLTDIGAPTLVMNCRIHPIQGTWILPEDIVEGYISWPKQLKHMSFDGRYLHAAPGELMKQGVFESQCHYIGEDTKEARRHRRVTFLANIWLNYRPYNVKPFPMIDKLSGFKSTEKRLRLEFGKRSEPVDELIIQKDEDRHGSRTFVWPMGNSDSGEYIEVCVPLDEIRRHYPGGNIRIKFHGSCVQLLSRDSEEPPSKKSKTQVR